MSAINFMRRGVAKLEGCLIVGQSDLREVDGVGKSKNVAKNCVQVDYT